MPNDQVFTQLNIGRSLGSYNLPIKNIYLLKYALILLNFLIQNYFTIILLHKTLGKRLLELAETESIYFFDCSCGTQLILKSWNVSLQRA